MRLAGWVKAFNASLVAEMLRLTEPGSVCCRAGDSFRKSLTVICGQSQTSFNFFCRVGKHPIVEAGPLRVAGIQLLVSQFAHVRAPPGLGGETAQHARPAAVGGFVAVGMQTGVEIGNRTPCANEGWFRKSFERVSEGRMFLETIIPSMAQSNCRPRQ